MTIAVVLFFVALCIFYARARAVVRQEMQDPNDKRLSEHVFRDTAEKRALLRQELRFRGYSKAQIESWMRSGRERERLQELRARHGRDPFPSRALAKRD